MFSPDFWKATAERAIKTFAQSLLAVLTVTSGAGVDWPTSLKAAGLAALISVLTSVASSTVGSPGPSLAGETLTATVAAETAPIEAAAEFVAGPAANVPEGSAVTVEAASEGDYHGRHEATEAEQSADSKAEAAYHDGEN